MEPTTIFWSLISFNAIAFLWDLYLNWRQYRVHLRNVERPEHVAELISVDDYRKARLYALDKHRFGFVTDVIGQVKLGIVLATNVLPAFWALCGGWALHYLWWMGGGEIAQSIVCTVLSSIIQFIIDLPFSYYSTFVIEERHGFNKQSRAFFFRDHFKQLALSEALSAPIVAGIVWIVRAGGTYFFVYVWLFISVVVFMLMFIYPEFIAPLFDDYTPLPESELKHKIEALAARLEFPLTKLYVVHGSKRSSHSNAYMYGFWRNKRIVLYDTLLSAELNALLKRLKEDEKEADKAKKEPSEEERTDAVGEEEEVKLLAAPQQAALAEDAQEQHNAEETAEAEQQSPKQLGMNDDEVVAVLGHELGHWSLWHSVQMLVVAEANILLMFAVFAYFYEQNALYVAFGFPLSAKQQPIIVGLVLVLQFVMAPYNELFGVAMSFFSRKNEFAADVFSAALGYATLLRSSLIKLDRDNLSMPINDWLYSAVNHSHPPTLERIEALKKHE